MNINQQALRVFSRALAVLCAISCVVTTCELVRPYDTAYDAAFIDGGEEAPADTTMPASETIPAIDAFSEIIERPLFMENRRPYVPPAPVVTKKPETPRPEEPDIATQISLRATIIIGDKRTALIQVIVDGKQQKLRQGEAFNGWTLADVQTDSISMKKGNEVRRIDLNTGPS